MLPKDSGCTSRSTKYMQVAATSINTRAPPMLSTSSNLRRFSAFSMPRKALLTPGIRANFTIRTRRKARANTSPDPAPSHSGRMVKKSTIAIGVKLYRSLPRNPRYWAASPADQTRAQYSTVNASSTNWLNPPKNVGYAETTTGSVSRIAAKTLRKTSDMITIFRGDSPLPGQNSVNKLTNTRWRNVSAGRGIGLPHGFCHTL